MKAAGPDGIGKIINAFYANHPHIPKRQVELKINEMAVKEKRPAITDKIIWYLRPEYEKYLDMENFESALPEKPAAASAGKGSKSKKGAAAAAVATSGAVVSGSPDEHASGGKGKATSKRPREKDSGELEAGAEGTSAGMPKKFKRAFGFFVKAKRAEAAKTLGPDYVRLIHSLRDEDILLNNLFCCALDGI